MSVRSMTQTEADTAAKKAGATYTRTHTQAGRMTTRYYFNWENQEIAHLFSMPHTDYGLYTELEPPLHRTWDAAIAAHYKQETL